MSKPKYKLLATDYITVGSRTLYRIEALRHFRDGVYPGKQGGYIERESNLSQEYEAWVADEALVYQDAVVCGDALVQQHAVVCGSAVVERNAHVGGYARVRAHARVGGSARVFEYATVAGSARVDGEAAVYGHSGIYAGHAGGSAHIRGESVVLGSAHLTRAMDISTFDCASPEPCVVTAYRTVNETIEVVTNGFRGSLDSFRRRVQAEHGATPEHKMGWMLLGLANLIEFQLTR
jgi:carbonic anhydrase/acetyltransferase-like protein (isoleucine patch superfamily)